MKNDKLVISKEVIENRIKVLLAEWQREEDKNEKADTAIQFCILTAIDELRDVLDSSTPL